MKKDFSLEINEKMKRQRRNKIIMRTLLVTLGLAAVVTVFVLFTHSAFTMEANEYEDGQLICGLEEHTHGPECYEKVLICGYEEGEPEDADEPPVETTDEKNMILICSFTKITIIMSAAVME